MKQFLPARPFLATVLLLVLALLVRPALASHLLGGELTYRYIDNLGPAAAPLRYEITVTVYNNCSPGAITPYTTGTIGIFNQATGVRLNLTTVNYAGASGGGADYSPDYALELHIASRPNGLRNYWPFAAL